MTNHFRMLGCMDASTTDFDHRVSRPIRWALDHPWRVVVAWIAVFVAAIAIIATLLPSALNNEQRVTNGPESQDALALMREHLPSAATIDEVVVVSSKRYLAAEPEFQAFIGSLAEQAPEGVAVAGTPGSGIDPGGQPPVSDDGRAMLVPLVITGDEPLEVADELVAAVERADRDPDFDVAVTGDWTVDHDLTELSETDLRDGELFVGLPAAMLVLLLVFGTVVGALMPALVAIVAIVCALALTALVGQASELNLFVVNMITGMGLALGIDYSLFVVSRYREERHQGSARDAALVASGATAGRAVLFSGMTFVVALTGMLLVPTTIMRSLAAGAIFVGLTAVLTALTLLPAVLRLVGDRIDSLAVPWLGRRAARPSDPEHGFWHGLVTRVMRRPVLWGGGVALLLAAMSLPLLSLETGASGVATFPERTASRQGFEALRTHFPDQASDPARIVVHDPDGIDVGALNASIDDLDGRLADSIGYGTPAVTAASDDGELAVVSVPVGADALAVDAVDRVRTLRSDHVPATIGELLGDDVQVLVTGETALQIDYFDVMSTWLPRVIAFVLLLSFAILLLVFRSLMVPIVAIALNLLSVGATYGLLVLVFQDGYGADLLGLRQVDVIDAWVPLFLFSVLFGLSMDYHMLLMTRIRERWLATGDTNGSVAWAISSTARLITGAALIIVAVFVGFAIGDLSMFQQMGFGIAVALLIDATLVRGVLLPAAMALLGERNWYLPRWLHRLPEVQVE